MGNASAARAYLHPVMSRSNLCVITKATANRLLLDGSKVIGVSFSCAGAEDRLKARREVVLSSGAFGSPQLLLLLGIGPAYQLKFHGIPVLRNLPGVGQKSAGPYRLRPNVSRAKRQRDVRPIGAHGLIKAMTEWRRKRTGTIASNFAESGAFFRSRDDIEIPDVQLHFVIGIVDDHGRRPRV
jgi:choline dehydrogenase-like flavoprotein